MINSGAKSQSTTTTAIQTQSGSSLRRPGHLAYDASVETDLELLVLRSGSIISSVSPLQG